MKDDIQVLGRATDVLLSLTEGPRTLVDIVRETGLARGTVFRLLGSLGAGGLVVKDSEDRTYAIGGGFIRLIQAANDRIAAITAVSAAPLAQLREATPEALAIHARMGDERVCVGGLASTEPVGSTVEVGAKAPLHAGAAGKVLLALMEPAAREELLVELPLHRLTEATISDPEALAGELAAVAAQGFALSTGERVADAAAVAVPVRGPDEELYALSVLGPSERLGVRTRLDLLPQLRLCAETIEAACAHLAR